MVADASSSASVVRIVGRYAVYGGIASGGMATVHLGRLMGPVGFARTVAIKRLHAQFAQDPDFVAMFLDEARLAARIHHPNVVPTLDVVATEGELFLVMEYVHGDSLSRLLRVTREMKRHVPPNIVSAIMSGTLHGLHAAHEAKSERGEPLNIVHRDVSPQNVLMGTDGTARVLDFGVAKATGRSQETRDGSIKGKIAYMAPEQLTGGDTTRLADIYSAGVLLWELLTGERLFIAANEGALLVKRVLGGGIVAPSQATSTALEPLTPAHRVLVESLDAVVLRAVCPDPSKRFATAREMALAIEQCVAPAPPSDVGTWVESVAAPQLKHRADLVALIESDTAGPAVKPSTLMSTLGVNSNLATEPEVDFTERDLQSLSRATVSSAIDTSVTQPRKRGKPIAIGAGALLAIGVLSIGLVTRTRSSPPQLGPSATAPFLASPALPEASTEPARIEPSAPPITPPSAREAAPDRPAGSAAVKRAPGSRPNRPPPVAPVSGPAVAPVDKTQDVPSPVDCWTIDARGIKKFNTHDPRCMQ